MNRIMRNRNSYFPTPRWALWVIGILVGAIVSVAIVWSGGPTDRLTRVWDFGVRALIIGVLVAEVINWLFLRRRKQ